MYQILRTLEPHYFSFFFGTTHHYFSNNNNKLKTNRNCVGDATDKPKKNKLFL